MKIKYLSAFMILIYSFNSIAQLGVKEANTTPHPKAMLDVESTSKGVLIPRLTTGQRNAIPLPPAGLMIYNSTENKYNYFNGSVWSEFVVGGFTLPFFASTNIAASAFEIINQNLTSSSAAIKGRAYSGNGVEGFTEIGSGVRGESYNGIGVYGSSLDYSSSAAIGVYGRNNSSNGVGILAVNFAEQNGTALKAAGNVGVALEIQGPVKVFGANKFAFVHYANVANKISANGTDINNALCNGDPNALLFVSQIVNYAGTVYNNSPIAAYYNYTRAKWEILNQNNTPIPTNAQFNVMVIKQ